MFKNIQKLQKMEENTEVSSKLRTQDPGSRNFRKLTQKHGLYVLDKEVCNTVENFKLLYMRHIFPTIECNLLIEHKVVENDAIWDRWKLIG
jgi:hypothetical protein